MNALLAFGKSISNFYYGLGFLQFLTDCCNWGCSFWDSGVYLYPLDTPGTHDKPGFRISQWCIHTVYLLCKEYLCVIVQLVCFNRIGMGADLFTSSLILFMMLVSFGFPFLSSYLYLVLRLGPWYSSSMGLARLIIQFTLVAGTQHLGAFTAALFIRNNKGAWEGAWLTETRSLVDQDHPKLMTQEQGFHVSWKFSNVDTDTTGSLLVLDELLCSFIFLIGLLHLMESDKEELMQSAFFRQKDLIETHVEIPENPGHDGTPSVRTNSDGTVFLKHTPIPVQFIAHVCILLAAVTRAFPIAHGTPAVTTFLWALDLVKQDAASYRMAGGWVGALAALLYYYIWYVWSGRPQKAIAEAVVTNLIIGQPSFMSAQLQLPVGLAGHRWGE